jgi:hypothetical protein
VHRIGARCGGFSWGGLRTRASAIVAAGGRAAISAGIALIEVPVTRRCEQIAVLDRCEGEASDGTLAALVVAVEDVDGGSVVRCDRGEELRG